MKKQYEEIYQDAQSEGEALERLIDIIKILRKECPWDKKQTHETLTTCLIEEAYEAVSAIRNHDTDNLEEEIGDVLLQVVFHGCLAEEKEEFSIVSCINRECEKMIRRHPHVFLEYEAKTIDKVLEKWENMKSKEHDRGKSQTEILEGVPKALPALMRSHKVQSKAAAVGFDWPDVSGAFAKIREETEELYDVHQISDKDKMIEELGDLLFSVVNVARFLSINPEEALEGATEKFIRRFAFIEETAKSENRNVADMQLGEMDKLWGMAKQQEVSGQWRRFKR